MHRPISLSPLLLAALSIALAPLAGRATVVGCSGNSCDYHYDITLDGLTAGVEDSGISWGFSFDWKGPLRFNSPPNSFIGFSLSGSPKTGWDFDTLDFTSSGTSPQVDIEYIDNLGDANNGSTVTFTIIEPDSFWATTGAQSFDSGAVTYAINGGDPGTCASPGACGVNTSTSLLPTPEPVSTVLLGLGITGLAFLRRRQVY